MINVQALFNKAAETPVSSPVDNGVKGVAIISDVVVYVSNQGRKANHFVASVTMGKGQWVKTVDAMGNETLSSKPTLIIQVYPYSQKESKFPSKTGPIKRTPSLQTKGELANLVKNICLCSFSLDEYTEQAAAACEDLQIVMKTLAECGVAVDKDCKKFSMKTFYLLPNDDGTYYLKAKGYNPNRKG